MWLRLILSLLCHVQGLNFGVFSILWYSSLHFIYYLRICDSFIKLVIFIEEGHICRPSILSSWHVMPKSAFIHLLLLVYDLMVLFRVIFKLFLVVHCNSFDHYLWIFFGDTLGDFLGIPNVLAQWPFFFSLGFLFKFYLISNAFRFRFLFLLHGCRIWSWFAWNWHFLCLIACT